MNDNQKYCKDDAFQTLDLINGWISNIDTKASFLLAYVAVIIGFIIASENDSIIFNILNSDVFLCKDILAFLLVSLFYSCCLCSIILIIIVITARIKNNNTKPSLLFFGAISNMSLNDYKAKVLNKSEEELTKDILEQVHTNSIICAKKCKLYNWAVKITIASTVLCFICIIFNIL